jgi:hypothetical protein
MSLYQRLYEYQMHAQTAIYDSKVKLFLKQGISRQLGRGRTQLFDLNARIQQLTWSLIFYEKYSTSLSYLWFIVKKGRHMFHCSENFRFDYTPVTVIQSVVIFPCHSPWYRVVTSLSYLWFWPPLILGGSVISAGTIQDLRRVQVPGTCPLIVNSSLCMR